MAPAFTTGELLLVSRRRAGVSDAAVVSACRVVMSGRYRGLSAPSFELPARGENGSGAMREQTYLYALAVGRDPGDLGLGRADRHVGWAPDRVLRARLGRLLDTRQGRVTQ